MAYNNWVAVDMVRIAEGNKGKEVVVANKAAVKSNEDALSWLGFP